MGSRLLKYPILQLDTANNIIREITFYNQIDQLGFTYQKVYSTIKGYQNTHKGYKFCYTKDYVDTNIDDSKYILKLDISGDVIKEYKRLKDVIYDYHTESGVYKALSKYNSNHHGYLWIYKKDYNKRNVNKLIKRYMGAEEERVQKMVSSKKRNKKMN